MLPALHPLHGKNFVFLGDSIFGNNQTTTGIANRFAHYTGANVENFAFGGARAAARPTDTEFGEVWTNFDGESVAKCIASGNYTPMKQAFARHFEGVPAYFENTLQKLDAYDWSKCDYIAANWGSNDWTARLPIEEYTRALRAIVETILTAYPQIIFVKLTPAMRFFNDNGVIRNSSVYCTYRNDGVYLNDFVRADYVLAEEPYNLQVVDCYNIGINNINREHFFNAPDYSHQNEFGRERIAVYLSGEIH